MLVKAKDIYNKAVDVIEELGWAQGQLGGRQREYDMRGNKIDAACCAVGAIRQAAQDITGTTGLSAYGSISLLRHALEEMIDFKPDDFIVRASITRWNDAPGRTKEEVIELLRKAAEKSGDAEVSIAI